METSLSRKSLALVQATQNKQGTIHQKHTQKKHKINKLAPSKKTHKKTLTKPKAAGIITPIRTAHMCALMTVYNCGKQQGTNRLSEIAHSYRSCTISFCRFKLWFLSGDAQFSKIKHQHATVSAKQTK